MPRTPLGAYPHCRLCDQGGRTPINIRTRMMITIVPRVMELAFAGVGVPAQCKDECKDDARQRIVLPSR